MAKRKMIQNNLIKNSMAAYYAAIEIHNKPSIAYRYETVTLLMMNAWELALKAYVKKYIKNRSIFTADGHTISIDKALDYVTEHRNHVKANSFTAVQQNILAIEKYRNNITHFYCDELEPYIFMLVARSALNYVDFVKEYLGKDVMADQGLFILPLGFKLPFMPEDFLSDNVAKYAASSEAKKFIKDIVQIITDLNENGIEDSIVLGFDLYFESVKKQTNSSILAAITSEENADVNFAKVTSVRFSEDASQVVSMSDDEFRKIWKYSHSEVVEWCKENIPQFKQGKLFNDAKKSIATDQNCVYVKRLDSTNSKSASQRFYTDTALTKIREYYLHHNQN
ncbi:MAG: DUF3644 domain-containing protein [Clostridiales bacterium]|nr:DUF3644 domain-containing protein [Clostridiales bacterium]